MYLELLEHLCKHIWTNYAMLLKSVGHVRQNVQQKLRLVGYFQGPPDF